jgi:hypothetical protein
MGEDESLTLGRRRIASMSWTPCGPNCGCVRKYSRFILSFAMSGTTVSTFDARGASRSVAYQNRRQRWKARSQHDGSPLDPPDYIHRLHLAYEQRMSANRCLYRKRVPSKRNDRGSARCLRCPNWLGSANDGQQTTRAARM